jgi:integrase
MSMNENQKPLQLLQLLDLDEGAAVGERLGRWTGAFESWLAERRSRLAATTAQISYTAWREFLALTGKPPWEATVSDVEAYLAALTKRKLRPNTIKLRLTGLARFYEYCQASGIDPQCPAGFNPVAGVCRPHVVKYEKANYLSRAEEAAFLAAIRRDPSPMGKRDYALFLMLLRTGWKSGEVCRLRWGSFAAAADGAPGGPGSAVRCLGEALPGEVWEAIREYLQASGRWEGIQPQEYVFAPSRVPLVREARERAQDWDSSRPLRKDGLRHLLRLHAGRAGLKAEAITTHTLRHTVGRSFGRLVTAS